MTQGRSGLGHAGAEQLSDLGHLGLGVQRPGADEHGHALARVQHLGGTGEVRVGGDDAGDGDPDPGVDGAVLIRRLGDRLLLLQVVGDDQASHRALGQRDAHRPVHEVAHLTRLGRHVDVLLGDVLEERVEVDLLLIVAAEGELGLLSDDGHHGLVVELRVVEAVQ